MKYDIFPLNETCAHTLYPTLCFPFAHHFGFRDTLLYGSPFTLIIFRSLLYNNKVTQVYLLRTRFIGLSSFSSHSLLRSYVFSFIQVDP